MAELVKALAWPVAAIVLALLLRPVVRDRLNEVEMFGVRAKFHELSREAEASADETPDTRDEQGAQPVSDGVTVDKDLYAIAETDPTRAIITAYEGVAEEVGRRLSQVDGVDPRPASGLVLARLARIHGVVDKPTADALQSMAELRNLVAHGRRAIRSVEAFEYLVAADKVLYSLSRRPGRSTTRYTVTQDGKVLDRHLPASQAYRRVAGEVADEIGVERVLSAVGPPRLGPSRESVTRPDRAKRVAPDLELWQTTQLNQVDLIDMAMEVASLSVHRFEIVPGSDM